MGRMRREKDKRGGNGENTQGRETEEEMGRIRREEKRGGNRNRRKWEEYAGKRIKKG